MVAQSWCAGTTTAGDTAEGATSVGVLTNGNMKTAQAISTSQSGVTPPSTWSAKRARAAVAGLLSIGPAPKATIPPGATAVAAGERMDISCAPLALEYEAVSATVGQRDLHR